MAYRHQPIDFICFDVVSSSVYLMFIQSEIDFVCDFCRIVHISLSGQTLAIEEPETVPDVVPEDIQNEKDDQTS